jgi:CubicO group peptidase (beta-lactamase class C family)
MNTLLFLSALWAPTAPDTTLRQFDSVEVTAFFDGVMAAFLRDRPIAGATLALVKDGKVLLAKGYGWADVERRVTVNPARTLFRIGSTSKLFTWTAVMQLAEEGKLDLDADINRYLDFTIPATFPEPITLRHLLTHGPGLEEDGRDLFTYDSTRIEAMSTWLPRHMPARVRPPGQFPSYSNWGTAVAGYIVERVSGIPWQEYLERRIFVPLGMAHTTARQPLPASLAPDMSRGYGGSSTGFTPRGWQIVAGAPPAGSMSSTATDMARFMLAHLGDGTVDSVRILADSTARLMHTRALGGDPRISGYALGFFEKSSHGLRIIGHGGNTNWFHTELALIPSEGIGIFASFNTDLGGTISYSQFLETFLDHYYPERAPPAAISVADLERFAGEYQSTRRSYSFWGAAFGMAGGAVVMADSAHLTWKAREGTMRLEPVDSLLFRDVRTGELVAFRADESGRMTHAFRGGLPMMGYERMSPAMDSRLHRRILMLAMAVFLGAVIAAVVRLVKRMAEGPAEPVPPLIKHGRRVVLAIALLQLLFWLGVGRLMADFWELLTGTVQGVGALLTLPVLAVPLTGVAAWIAVQRWRRKVGSAAGRFGYSLAVLVVAAYLWSLAQWNLLGWRF